MPEGPARHFSDALRRGCPVQRVGQPAAFVRRGIDYGSANRQRKGDGMKSRKKDEVDRFKTWLTARGGEVLIATNEWEIVRFRGDGVTSIIYTNKAAKLTYTGRAQDAWTAFKKNDNSFRLAKRTERTARKDRPTHPIVRTLIERDGAFCFYCADQFTETLKPTREHLVPITAGGPNHLSNLFLACEPCNVEAGHMSAPEKIRLRDRKRRGRGSKLLERSLSLIHTGDSAFAEEVRQFLQPTSAITEEKTNAVA